MEVSLAGLFLHPLTFFCQSALLFQVQVFADLLLQFQCPFDGSVRPTDSPSMALCSHSGCGLLARLLQGLFLKFLHVAWLHFLNVEGNVSTKNHFPSMHFSSWLLWMPLLKTELTEFKAAGHGQFSSKLKFFILS